eukprot:23792-Eustigmatos_ZCMA.PRE.1
MPQKKTHAMPRQNLKSFGEAACFDNFCFRVWRTHCPRHKSITVCPQESRLTTDHHIRSLVSLLG